jgi:hypothetical protein
MGVIPNRGMFGLPGLPFQDNLSYEGSDVFIDMTFVDHTGTPVIPSSFTWELDDITNANNMIASTVVYQWGIVSFGTYSPGSGYTNGTFVNVPVTGGSGSGATINITVSGGVVTALAVNQAGNGYLTTDTISFAATSIGSGGSGFSAPVATTTGVSTYTLQLPGSEMVMTHEWQGSQYCQLSLYFTAIDSVTNTTFTGRGITIIELVSIQTPYGGS